MSLEPHFPAPLERPSGEAWMALCRALPVWTHAHLQGPQLWAPSSDPSLQVLNKTFGDLRPTLWQLWAHGYPEPFERWLDTLEVACEKNRVSFLAVRGVVCSILGLQGDGPATLRRHIDADRWPVLMDPNNADIWWHEWAQLPSVTADERAHVAQWAEGLVHTFMVRADDHPMAPWIRQQWLAQHSVDLTLHPAWATLQATQVEPIPPSLVLTLQMLHSLTQGQQSAGGQSLSSEDLVDRLVEGLDRLGWQEWAWTGLGRMTVVDSADRPMHGLMGMGLASALRDVLTLMAKRNPTEFHSGAVLEAFYRIDAPELAERFAFGCQALAKLIDPQPRAQRPRL